ncbi:MAG: PAS domain-containing protein, partial [Mailhella sp.]|nr:PAS domain-containing protein [Mailhella sp.]
MIKAPSIVPDRESCYVDMTTLPSGGAEPSDAPQDIPLDSILDSLDDGIIVLDPQGMILKANPAFRRMFTSAATGMHAASVVPGATFREMLDSFLHDFLPERHASPAFRVLMDDDHVLSVRITPPTRESGPSSGERTPGAVATFHNVSDLA